MSELRNLWNKLKNAAGVKECVVCEENLDDIIANHSRKLTGLYLCYKHLKMYQRGQVDWNGQGFVETK